MRLTRFLNKYYVTMLFGAVTASAVTILSYSTHVFADNPEVDRVNITVPVSCTLDGSGMDSHSASLLNREYKSEIGSTTITAYCNDLNGFTIYAVGFTDDTYGKTVMTSANDFEYDIVTGTATSGNVSNWAMKLAAVSSPSSTYPLTIDNGFGGYSAVPSSFTKVAHRNSFTDIGTSAEGATLTTTYAIYVSSTQPAGTYTGQVKYTLIHPNIINSNSSPVETQPDVLYSMQNVADWEHKIAEGQTTYAVDERDGEVYTVARLADGKLWMTRNLRLNLATANLTTENTNTTNQEFLSAAAGVESSTDWCTDSTTDCYDSIQYNSSRIGNFTDFDPSGHPYDDHGVYYNWYTATAGLGTYEKTDDHIAGDICPSGWQLPKGWLMSTNINSDFGVLTNAIGGYKNAAGFAQTMNNNTTPTASYIADILLASPYSFTTAGVFYGSNSYFFSEGASLWTSTPNLEYAYYAHVVSMLSRDSIVPNNDNNNKRVGLPVRCIAKS